MKRVSSTHVATGVMLDLLMRVGNVSAAEIAEESGLIYLTVCRMLNTWHRMRVVHVSGWEPDSAGRMKTRLWSLGHKASVKRPARRTSTERGRAREARQADALLLGVVALPRNNSCV